LPPHAPLRQPAERQDQRRAESGGGYRCRSGHAQHRDRKRPTLPRSR